MIYKLPRLAAVQHVADVYSTSVQASSIHVTSHPWGTKLGSIIIAHPRSHCCMNIDAYSSLSTSVGPPPPRSQVGYLYLTVPLPLMSLESPFERVPVSTLVKGLC